MALTADILRSAFAHGRHRFWFLLTTAVIVFVPVGLLEVFNEGIEIDTDEGIDGLRVLEGFVIATTALLGEVFYAGAVASVVSRGPGFHPTVGHLVRTIPWLTIVLIDLIFAFSVALGLVALFLPGLYIYGCWVLAATIAEIDHVKVREALRRSARLTKGYRLPVVVVLLGTMALSELLSEALEGLFHHLTEDDFISEWLSAAAAGILISPVFALLCVAFVLELRKRKDAPG